MSVHYSSAVWSTDLSDPTSKLVLLRLADHANDRGECWPSVASICKATGLCERSVQGKLRALEKSGIIKITRGVNRSSYFLSMESLHPTPQDLHPAGDAPRKRCHLTPQDLHPTPQTVPPHPAEFAAPYKEPSKNRQRTVKEPSMAEMFPIPHESSSSKAELEAMAESIYQAYPRKVAKDKAIAAISKAMKKISPSTLLEKTNVYAQSVKGKERNFIPHPATWFNGRRFNDDPEEWQHPMNSAPSTARALDLAGRGEYESTAIES